LYWLKTSWGGVDVLVLVEDQLGGFDVLVLADIQQGMGGCACTG